MRTIANRIILSALALLSAAGTAHAGSYTQTNLIADQSGMGAQVVDPDLINPWGISFSGGSPFWVSNQGAGGPGSIQHGTSTLYSAAANSGGLTSTKNALVVSIPNLGSPPAPPSGLNGPTGQVSTAAPGITTGASDFLLNGTKAAFIFANLDGSVSAWNGGATSVIMPTATVAGASFTGLAIGNSGGAAFLYAADQKSPNVDTFNSSWQMTGHLQSDPNLPSGYVAFNVQNLGGTLYVTFANPNSALGGVVDTYRTDGTLIGRLITDTAGTHLQTPWGVAIAPAGWGQFGGDLLVGNNDGDGTINAYTLGGTWAGQLTLTNGKVFSEVELWGLAFGNGGNGGRTDVLYFAAGLTGGQHGLFGALAVPEPSSAALGLIALGTLTAGWGWKNRRRAATP
jgi:uncharacterized protein (TIGR03118 family)